MTPWHSLILYLTHLLQETRDEREDMGYVLQNLLSIWLVRYPLTCSIRANICRTFNVDILSAKLFVRKLQITPSLYLAHERINKHKTAKYPIMRVECKVIHLPQGQNRFIHDSLFMGQLPKRIELGLVENHAFNGAFYTQFTGGDGTSSDTGNTIDRAQYVNGHAMYCFDLTPDLNSSCRHHFSVTKMGNLRLELGFEVAISIQGNVLVYSESANVLEIDKNKKGTGNYGHWTFEHGWYTDHVGRACFTCWPCEGTCWHFNDGVKYEYSVDTGQRTLCGIGLYEIRVLNLWFIWTSSIVFWIRSFIN